MCQLKPSLLHGFLIAMIEYDTLFDIFPLNYILPLNSFPLIIIKIEYVIAIWRFPIHGCTPESSILKGFPMK